MKKYVAISDTHGSLLDINIPEGDILLIAGDITPMGRESEIKKFTYDLRKVIKAKKFEKVVMIAGNHDWMFQNKPLEAESIISQEVDYYLLDSGCTIDGTKIWGSPWQPTFCNWAFNLDRGLEINKKWNLIPEDTDILITHGPPLGKLDVTRYGNKNIGCENLKNKIDQLPYIKYHIFGHNHVYGSVTENNITYINASMVDDKYQPIIQSAFSFNL